MNLEVSDHVDRDEWDDDDFENMGISAKVYHDTEQNASDGPNRHAVVLGNDVFVVEETE